jgi:hypothetical protein
MPALARCFLQAALLHFAFGATWGAAMLLYKAFPLHPVMWTIFPAHVESMLFGWIVQFAFGVAYWMLPHKGDSAGGPSRFRYAWVAWITLNAGVLLAGYGPLFGLAGIWVFAGRMLEWIAVLAFSGHVMARLRAVPIRRGEGNTLGRER